MPKAIEKKLFLLRMILEIRFTPRGSDGFTRANPRFSQKRQNLLKIKTGPDYSYYFCAVFEIYTCRRKNLSEKINLTTNPKNLTTIKKEAPAFQMVHFRTIFEIKECTNPDKRLSQTISHIFLSC